MVDRFRFRLVPALLLALGIGILGTGLVSYTTAAEPSPLDFALDPLQPMPTIDPSLVLPGAAGTAAPDPSFPPDRVATRIVIPRIGIDLPVVNQPDSAGTFPLCDVAMYYASLGQPGSGRATYIYAHAARGMFLPLLAAANQQDGKRLIGATVQVYTSDNKVFLYKIDQIWHNPPNTGPAFADHVGRLWLQTCEGQDLGAPKLWVIGDFVSVSPASISASHPTPHARVCG